MAQSILLSTWNFGLRANAAGWPHATRIGGILDALEQTCIACELDPAVDSVGVGGLPDASGEVSLDGAVMLSPARSAGVGYVRRYAHPVSIARRVMEKTPHKLMVGEGAEAFAAREGFAPAQLLSDSARQRWEQWRQTGVARVGVGQFPAAGARGRPRDGLSSNQTHDTLGVIGLDAGGSIGAACTTSGRAFKLPGRIGDSPLIGHGLYCDPSAGAAVATGTGELMIGIAACFLVVERMRSGERAIDAIRYTLGRVSDSYHGLTEHDQCALIALAPDGHFASGALRPGFELSVTSADRNEVVAPDVVMMGATSGSK